MRSVEQCIVSALLNTSPEDGSVNRQLCISLTAAAVRRQGSCRELLFELLQCPVAACPILQKTLAQGVAYHHAGLTLDERKVVERGFKEGSIKVLCATSTLAAGVGVYVFV